jgi:hypothetical protein
MASLKVVLLNGAKAKSFSISVLASELHELTKESELLLGKIKILTQILHHRGHIFGMLGGMHPAKTYQRILENNVLHRKEIVWPCKDHIQSQNFLWLSSPPYYCKRYGSLSKEKT